MILQRLVEHYDRLATEPGLATVLARPGYSRQKISFCVVLEPDGRLQQFQSLLDTGRTRPVPRQLLVPGEGKPTGSGINPGFLWDNAAYMLGFAPESDKPLRTLASFQRFRDRHLEVQKEVSSHAFDAVCAFLRNWTPDEAYAHTGDLRDITGAFGIFAIAGQLRYVHEDPAVVTYWERVGQRASADPRGTCLVTGTSAPIARVHEPRIKGVAGAQSSGALLVSFNDTAYASYGKEQSHNAPVSVSAAFRYANALNHLLSSDRRLLLGDTTVVFWAERRSSFEEIISDLWGDTPPPSDSERPEDKRRADQVRLFLSQLRDGHGGAPAIEDGRTRFFVLGLSPNASRLSVRFWADSTIAEMQARLAQHMRDMDLVGMRGGDVPPVLGRVVQAAGRAQTDARGNLRSYDADAVPPVLAGALARAIFTGGPYPHMLLAVMVNRLRSDGVINHTRVAAIKACLARTWRLIGSSKEVSVALDPAREDPSYVSGRLFALLEKIQADSTDGEINASIKDRYFSSASATPSIVFPRLIRLSQHHLAKMDTGRKIYFERQLGEVMGKLDSFPRRLDLENQGLFAVGYFHQRQDLFTPRKDKTEVTA